jgi:mannosyltransferase
MMWRLVHVPSSHSDPRARPPRRPTLRFDAVSAGLGLIAIAAAAAALAARWGHSLNVDEPFTALAVAQPLPSLLETLRHDNTPVTYVALKIWSRLAGDSELALRSLMAASYAVAVLATGMAGLRLGGARSGLAAALLVASSGSVGLLHAATIRPYALLCLFSALAAQQLMAQVRSQTDVSGPRWVALTATHLLGLFTHPIYVFLALGSAAAVLIARGSRGRALATTGLVATAIYVAAWGWMLRATLSLPATAWLATPHSLDLWNAYLAIWGNRNGFLLVGAALALLTASGAARRLFEDDAIRIVALTAAFALAGPFVVSYVKPVFHLTRTPTLALPFVALTAAGILTALGSRTLIAVLGLSLALGGWQYVAASRRHGDPDPTRQSLAQVLARARCGDVLISAGLSYAPMEYYLRRLAAPQCISHQVFPAEVSAHPGWLDAAAFAREGAAYQAEAAAAAERFARSTGRVFAFTKSRGLGADVSELLARELAVKLRPEESLPLRGAFFDRVTEYVSPAEASRR